MGIERDHARDRENERGAAERGRERDIETHITMSERARERAKGRGILSARGRERGSEVGAMHSQKQ